MDPIITINLINAIHRRDKATSNAILNQLKKEMVYAGLNPNDPEQETNKLKRFKQMTKGV